MANLVSGPQVIAAEKAGLVLQNVNYREQEWQGEWLDALQFHVLRSEWPVPAREGRSEQ